MSVLESHQFDTFPASDDTISPAFEIPLIQQFIIKSIYFEGMKQKEVAEMLVEWKKRQDKIKKTLGDEYMDYNLVMATPFGFPVGTSSIRKALNDLIKEHDLPPVVFHSLRHYVECF